ncbi:MAG: RNHCP domain-containing protein [Alphaproteobacteria bacterium]|nr:RNHCP domain-containing protein [Alphaproteobacteria bacterium]
MVKNFTKTVENFICDVCGETIYGNGYTNHCPHCLSSKHVDIQPGDRLCDCHGVMFAVGYEQRNGAEWITHQCEKCHFQRRNKVAVQDSRKALRALSCGHFDTFLIQFKK